MVPDLFLFRLSTGDELHIDDPLKSKFASTELGQRWFIQVLPNTSNRLRHSPEPSPVHGWTAYGYKDYCALFF